MLNRLRFNPAGEDRPLLAAGLLLIGVVILALQDSSIKLISAHTSLWQIQALRSLSNLVLLLLLAACGGGLNLLLPHNARIVFLRATFLAVCMFCFFVGAPHLSVAQMGAGLYTYPVFVSLLASRMLGETVGPWRIASIVIGMMGALIVLSPWQESFSLIQALPTLAGFFYACNILIVRRYCRHENTLALAFAVSLVFLVSSTCGIAWLTVFPFSAETQAALPFATVGWPELTFWVAGSALALSLLNLSGNLCLTRAYQTADASLLAPLDFSYLLFVAIWGKVMFDQWPDAQSMLGMVLIIAAGVLIVWREQVARQRRA